VIGLPGPPHKLLPLSGWSSSFPVFAGRALKYLPRIFYHVGIVLVGFPLCDLALLFLASPFPLARFILWVRFAAVLIPALYHDTRALYFDEIFL